MAKKYKLIVFDLDGTLINSSAHILNLLNQIRDRLNKPRLELGEVGALLSLGGEKIITGALGVSESDVPKHLRDFRELYLNQPTPVNSLFPQVRELLDYLSGENMLLSICTNKNRALVNKVLEELSLTHYFSSVCADGDLPTKKPNPSNLQYCLDACRINPEDALMVGDSKVDQELALACGVPFAWFSGDSGGDGVVVEHTVYQFNDYSAFKFWLSN